MLSVHFAYVNPSGKGPGNGRFYGVPLKKRTEQAWRIIVDNRWALRPGFLRERDAQSAKASLERAGINTTDAVLGAGWNEVQRVMYENLAW